MPIYAHGPYKPLWVGSNMQSALTLNAGGVETAPPTSMANIAYNQSLSAHPATTALISGRPGLVGARVHNTRKRKSAAQACARTMPNVNNYSRHSATHKDQFKQTCDVSIWMVCRFLSNLP